MNTQQKARVAAKALKQGMITVRVLEHDCVKVGELAGAAHAHDRLFWRRIVFRSLGAYIEGSNAMLRQVCIPVAAFTDVTFTTQELDLIREQRRRKDKAGNEIVGVGYERFPQSMCSAFSLFAKAHGVVLPPLYGVVGYEKLCSTFKVRDRLMHPKSVMGLNISDAEYEDARLGLDWFCDTLHVVFDKCGPVIAARIKACGLAA